ncbi:MAG: cohesin domain-containing protein [Gammaproteobacteria bacterium]
MSTYFTRAIFILTFSLLAGPLFAATLSLHPDRVAVSIGEIVSIDLIIADLGAQTAPSLGILYTDIDFDDSRLKFESVTFGHFLGDPENLSETDVINALNGNRLSLEEVSFLSVDELDALQPGEFSLATLTFLTLRPGQANLDVIATDLSDAQGNSLLTNLPSTSIMVVPLPPSVVFFLPGLFALCPTMKLRLFS